MKSIRIIGTGSYLPGPRIDNEQLAARFGRQMIWLTEMFGSRTRHFAIDLNNLELRRGESNTHMATEAAKQAIEDAGIDPLAIDLIVMATSTPDYPFPATALFVQEQLGIPDCCVMELRAGCGGMAQAFLIAKHLLENEVNQTALLIGSDLISPYISLFKYDSIIDKDYLVSLAMFGDGAGAVVLDANSPSPGILDVMSRSMSTGRAPGMILRTGGSLSPVGDLAVTKDMPKKVFSHDFKTIMAQGPSLIEASAKWLFEERKYDATSFDYFVPPQVNNRLIDMVASAIKVEKHKVFTNFDQVGNTVSASIYIALDQMNRSKILRFGDLLVLLPTEATKWLYGGIVIKWSKS